MFPCISSTQSYKFWKAMISFLNLRKTSGGSIYSIRCICSPFCSKALYHYFLIQIGLSRPPANILHCRPEQEETV